MCLQNLQKLKHAPAIISISRMGAAVATRLITECGAKTDLSMTDEQRLATKKKLELLHELILTSTGNDGKAYEAVKEVMPNTTNTITCTHISTQNHCPPSFPSILVAVLISASAPGLTHTPSNTKRCSTNAGTLILTLTPLPTRTHTRAHTDPCTPRNLCETSLAPNTV